MSDKVSENIENICEFCDHSFSTKRSLNNHLKTGKKCLKKRGLIIDKEYNCLFCSKKFVTKSHIIKHIQICITKSDPDIIIDIQEKHTQQIKDNEEKYIQHIKELEEKIERLNQKFQDIATMPRTVNTNNTNNQNRTNNTVNYLNLNDNDRVKEVLQNIKPEDIAGGQAGVAKFIFTAFLTTQEGEVIYKCVDTARQNFSFINEHGDRDKDVKCNKLTSAMVKNNITGLAWKQGENLWIDEYSGKVDTERRDYFEDKVLEVASIDRDNSKFVSEITKLTA